MSEAPIPQADSFRLLHQEIAHRIQGAARDVFGRSTAAAELGEIADRFLSQTEDVLQARGLNSLAIAVVGVKGQGKTWLVRQFVKNDAVLQRLVSGVLQSEATTQLHWVGTTPPQELDNTREVFHRCDANQMADLGEPYLLLDTPGTTDSNPQAARIAEMAMSLAPVKLLVVRRDQLRSAANSIVSHWIEGAVCIPVITAVPPRELPGLLANNDTSLATASVELQSDVQQLVDLSRRSAPLSNFETPILIEDFESSGAPDTAGLRLIAQVQERLKKHPLSELAQTRRNRLTAIRKRLHSQVNSLIAGRAPRLPKAVEQLHAEAAALPSEVVESVTGSPVILQTAVRSRLRTQIVTDTSPILFPYRTILTLLSLTQGAWDRLVLTLTGSVPSLFGTLASWAKNLRQSQKVDLEMRDGIRQRMHRQIEDRLQPMNRQFHRVVTELRDEPLENSSEESPAIRLDGIDELQDRSLSLFERIIESAAIRRLHLNLIGLAATVLFWVLLAGPIFSVYRQYFSASYGALSGSDTKVESFPHPSPTLLFTSVLLSVIPVLIGSMVIMAILLRKSRIETVSRQIANSHKSLVEELKRKDVLRLQFEDRCLEQAEYLITVGQEKHNRPENGESK